MMGLTQRQADCLAFIHSRHRAGQLAPTFQEIADHFGVAKSSVHRWVKALIARGHLRQMPRRRQSMALIEPGLRGDSEGLLAQLAARRGIPRDRLVQQAVSEFLERELRA